MKFHVSLITYFLLFTSLFFLYSTNKNESILLTDSFKIANPNSADSVIYLKDQWGLTTITTLKQINEYKPSGKIPNPFAPPTPFGFNILKVSEIKMDIIDSTDNLMKTYKFVNLEPGDYQIQWWAFYRDLPAGKYTYELDLPGQIEKHLIIKAP